MTRSLPLYVSRVNLVSGVVTSALTWKHSIHTLRSIKQVIGMIYLAINDKPQQKDSLEAKESPVIH